MTRLVRTLTALLIVAGAGCTDTDAAGPSSPHPQFAAVATRGTGVLTADNVVFFDCVGELVHTVLNAPYTFHLVTLPSGEHVYHDHWDPHAVTGSLTGLSSGTVWTRDRNRSPFIDITTGGGMIHWTFTGIFVSETGPTLRINEIFHLRRNAGGELVVQKHEFRCEIAPTS